MCTIIGYAVIVIFYIKNVYFRRCTIKNILYHTLVLILYDREAFYMTFKKHSQIREYDCSLHACVTTACNHNKAVARKSTSAREHKSSLRKRNVNRFKARNLAVGLYEREVCFKGRRTATPFVLG